VIRALKLWAELFALSWRRAPAMTAAALGSLFGTVIAIAGGALALRAAVDATTRNEVDAALVAAVGAALAYALMLVVQDVTDSLVLSVADRMGRMEIHPRIHLDLATLETLDHLERTEYLDRVTLVRKAGGRLMAGMWNALRSVVSVVSLAITLLLLGSISPLLLPLLAFAAIPIWCDYRGQRAVQRADLATAEPYRLQQHLFAVGTEAGSGKEIRVAGAGSELIRRQSEAWRAAMGPRLRAQWSAGAWTLAGWTVFVAAFVAGLVLAAYQTARGNGTVGDLVLLVTVAATLRQSVQLTIDSTLAAAGARQYIGPYLWLRDYAAAARAASAGTVPPPPALRDAITLENLTYRYPGTERLAVDGISVRLPAGSVVAIVGEYGSGKTTLVKLLCKFYRPDSGRILVDGVDLAELSTEAWRSRSAAAFQDFGRFHTRFAETVGLGDLPNLTNVDRIRQALRDGDADDLAESLPDGLDTQLGPHLGGVELSEGQWQRSALARASMRTDPLLFVLDEPTASLDAVSEQAIFHRYMDRSRALAEKTGAVTVIVSHRFSTVTGADLILVLDKGRLTEVGSHQALIARGGGYAELYGIQANAYRRVANADRAG
jgi:ATP-binding cassette subfamily B protein